MFPDHLRRDAEHLLVMLRQRGLLLATAESCTGGLIASLLTDLPGASDVFDRGFITYSNDAKTEMLGVRGEVLASHGAVSREAALAMAEGALLHSISQLAIAVTGLAGPGGGTREKPVGLVHVAAARIGSRSQHREYRFGPLSREAIRMRAVEAALALIRCAADAPACD